MAERHTIETYGPQPNNSRTTAFCHAWPILLSGFQVVVYPLLRSDPKEMAHLLKGYFSCIGQSLANKIPHATGKPEDYMSSPVCNSFALIPTNPQEIINIARGAKYSRSTGPDGIDPLIGKRTIIQTSGIITEIINSSFETGQIPPGVKEMKNYPNFQARQ